MTIHKHSKLPWFYVQEGLRITIYANDNTTVLGCIIMSPQIEKPGQAEANAVNLAERLQDHEGTSQKQTMASDNLIRKVTGEGSARPNAHGVAAKDA